MQHSHWDSWLHFIPATALMSVPWWVDFIEKGERQAMFIIGASVGILQIAYLIRKHRRLGK